MSVTLRHIEYGYDTSNGRPFGQPSAWHLLVPARLQLIDKGGRYLLDSSAGAEVVKQQPGRDLFTQFLRLARVDPESKPGAQRVLTFARKWGVLDICSHGLPGPTPPCCGVERLRQPDPVSAYRGYARHLNGLCAVAQAIRDGRPRRSEDWDAVAGAPIARGVLDPPSDFRPIVEPLAYLQLDRWPYVAMDPLLRQIGKPAAERAVVGVIVNRWLAVGAVQPALDWSSSQVPGFRLGGGHLVGALAQGILQAVSGQEGFVLCSVCGNPYPPKRQPRTGELRYCEECRGSRQRMRAHRERRRHEPADE